MTVLSPRGGAGRPSFAAVAEAHLDAVYRYLAHLTGDRDLAEDLASATFERALRAWGRFDPSRGEPRVWLLRIARRLALDHFRGEGRRRIRETRYAVARGDAAPAPEAGGLSPPLRAALARLTRGEREVLALRVVLDLDAREAGALMGGVSASAVGTQLHRALVKLREGVDRDAA